MSLPALSDGFWGTRRVLSLPRFPFPVGVTAAFFTILLYLLSIDLARSAGAARAHRIGCPSTHIGGANDWMDVRCPSGCLRDWAVPVVRVGDGQYSTLKTRVCAAAIDAGALTPHGGCFRARVVNGTMTFQGTPDGASCNSVRTWVDVYVAVSMVVLFFCIRHRYMFHVLIMTGGLYLITDRNVNDETLWVLINAQSPKLLTLFLASHAVPPGTFPSKFPVDALLFYFVPFWAGVHMEAVQDLGVTASFTDDWLETPAHVVGLALFITAGVPLVAAQSLLFYRAGMLRSVLVVVAASAAAVGVVAAVNRDYMTLHVHHYMVGGAGLLFFRGQPRLRYSIIMQALMLGVFVHGVAVWNTATLFKEGELRVPAAADLYWTSAGANGTFEWATADTVLKDWNCTLRDKFYAPRNVETVLLLRRRSGVFRATVQVPYRGRYQIRVETPVGESMYLALAPGETIVGGDTCARVNALLMRSTITKFI